MRKNKWYLILVSIIVLIIIALIYKKSIRDPRLDTFASCLKEKKAMMYGAFWCSHCQSQKALFGDSKDLIPYTECSNPDQSQIKICVDKKIESYPTWEFADGTRTTGQMSFKELADKTGCVLPQ